MIAWGILAIALIALYFIWYQIISIWIRLGELGVGHKKSFISFFDGILLSGLFALAVSRITWMFMNISFFTDVPWGLVPYLRSATGISWFSVFPWRFLLFTEGIVYPVLWGTWGLLIIVSIFMPTLSLVGKLKVDKKRVMNKFRLDISLGIFAVIMVALLAIYFSL